MNDKLYSALEEYLERDHISYADMLDSVRSGRSKPVYASEDGAMIFQESSRLYTIAADSPEAAAPMLDMIEEPDMVLTHLDSIIPEIQKRFEMPGDMYCRQFVYDRPRPLTAEAPIGVTLRELTEDDADFVRANYHNDSLEYILSRIEEGMLGAMYDGRLSGFIGGHSEGAIGMLFVSSECRRLGIGEALLSSMVNRRLSHDRIPFDHVVLGNAASMKLQQKLGLSLAEKPAVWIFND